MTKTRIVCTAWWLASICGCEPGPGEGTLRIAIHGEDFIEAAIPAEEVVDGWSIDFTKFLVVVDAVAADGVPIEGRQVFDLTRPSDGAGHEVTMATVPSGTVEYLDYRVGPGASATAGNAHAGDVEAANRDGWSIYVEGTATRGDESVGFMWAFDTDTSYLDCATDLSVPDGGEATSQITIHADHLFYDDLESPEPNLAFDLVASADADADGMVTRAELRAVDITTQARYQVGSRDIADLWSFIEAQTHTVGHIDGEGHCEAIAQ